MSFLCSWREVRATFWGCLQAVTFALLVACGGHTARTLPVRSALDEGAPREALRVLNDEMDVKRSSDIPKDLEGDNALLLLDRASVHQSLRSFRNSQRDFQAADKAIEMLDLSPKAMEDFGKYMFSDSIGKYRAPPFEKLLINTFNMVNYLEQGDLDGAKVEARRLGVMHKYLRDKLKDEGVSLGLAAFLAGSAFLQAGDPDTALHWFDDALRYRALAFVGHDVARAVARGGSYRSKRIEHALAKAGPTSPDGAEVLFIIGDGRVPHKVAVRLPIGLAVARVGILLSATTSASALAMAGQGAVTWINYPTLEDKAPLTSTPVIKLDGIRLEPVSTIDLSSDVRQSFRKLEDVAIASAITRAIVRAGIGAGVGTAVGAAAGRGGGGLGFLAGLLTQAAMAAADTPDTRSWETLPGRVVVARLRVAPGTHQIVLASRGESHRESITVAAGATKVVSLFALR